MKRPAFQFYPADWQSDSGLKLCSLAARGLWIEMICVMHASEPYGHLCAAGRPLDARDLAKLVGESERDVKRWLDELIRNNVCSVVEGAFVSRRMVRDENLRERRASGGVGGSEFGALGAEHGRKGGRTRKETGDKKPPLKPPLPTPIKPPPSSSSSSSSSSSENQIPSVPDGTDGCAVETDQKALSKIELWEAGKSLLERAGVPAKQCGSFVGKLVKDYGNEVVLQAVRATVVAQPADPAEYLKAACRNAAGQRLTRAPPPQEPAWRTEQRAVVQTAVPGIAARRPQALNVIDLETIHAPAKALG